MRTRTQNGVVGTDHLAGYAQGQQERTHNELQFFDSTTVKVEHTVRGIRLHAKSNPSASDAGDVWMTLISYNQDQEYGDYLVCRPPGAPSDGSGDVNVAVEPQLQSSVGWHLEDDEDVYSQTMPGDDGTTWTYTDYDETNQRRTSTSDEETPTVLTEYITPAFVLLPAPDLIPVRASTTNVTVDGVKLTLAAITGRQWANWQDIG
jgi:hypothetical protein